MAGRGGSDGRRFGYSSSDSIKENEKFDRLVQMEPAASCCGHGMKGGVSARVTAIGIRNDLMAERRNGHYTAAAPWTCRTRDWHANQSSWAFAIQKGYAGFHITSINQAKSSPP